MHRADPGFWHPAYTQLLSQMGNSAAQLGDCIKHITYGRIITGRPVPDCPPGTAGVALVNQGQIAPAGVDLCGAHRVPAGSDWDAPRARLLRDDLVIARSGVGSLAKNRLAVYLHDEPAVVGSFVDLVRLEGLDAVYVAVFLKSRFGWGQIHRLLNGVATPNISFDEIRGLKIVMAPAPVQATLRREYLCRVHTLHERGDPGAGKALRGLVLCLERCIMTGNWCIDREGINNGNGA